MHWDFISPMESYGERFDKVYEVNRDWYERNAQMAGESWKGIYPQILEVVFLHFRLKVSCSEAYIIMSLLNELVVNIEEKGDEIYYLTSAKSACKLLNQLNDFL